MEKNELDIKANELITIEQLPKIFYQLEKVGNFIDNELKDLDKLACTDETKQIVKNKRTEINNTLKDFENARKEVKNKILESYNLFEQKYNEEIKKKLENASACLTDKINTIENEQKENKRKKLENFFNEYREYYHLDTIINFEDLNLNITLSASETSLKEEIKKKLESISEDLIAISSEEYKEEILLEYKTNGYNYTKAINTINAKHKELEDLKKKVEELANVREQEKIVVENVNTLCSAPIEIHEEEQEEIIEVSFKVKTSKTKILQLKQWLKENEVDYE